MTPTDVLATLLRDAGLPERAIDAVSLTGAEPVLPSSFAVGTAAQCTIAAAAAAALELAALRGTAPQRVSVDMREAALECCGYFRIDGRVPQVWDKIAGLYPCADAAADLTGGAGGDGGDSFGWVRIHTNFAHHRDGVLGLLGLPTGPDTSREAVAAALSRWRALDFERAAAQAKLVVAAVRSFEQWGRHPHAPVIAGQPLVAIERIGEAPPLTLPALPAEAAPLQGLRVLDLTRILAGPTCGRVLAAYGADVMLVNSPGLPNIESIAETSRGKLSTHIDLRQPAGTADLARLTRDAQVFVQGYRPGGLTDLGFGPQQLARMRPGIVYVSLSAYGEHGPWAGKRGFDSLVQTATGFNHAEAIAAGDTQPRALPMQILDYATGFLMAFGAQAALLRQQREGGSWHVRVSLARTAHWLRGLGRIGNGFAAPKANFDGLTETRASGFGELVAVSHMARFSRTAAVPARPSMPPGTHPPRWP